MPAFGRYTLVRPIGKGGMAEIWKAKVSGPSGFERVLALKTVLPELAEDREFIAMFIEEAKLSAQLIHPNIVQVFDFGQIGGKYFLAMEYVAGGNLARYLNKVLDQGTTVPPEVAIYIALEVTRGLGYAHSRTDASGQPLAIVHRDVSPQNLLVGTGGEVKVSDFGIAKAVSMISRTAVGHIRGKVSYMSPEQAGVKPLDGRSDLFSVGLILWEMVVGRRFFFGQSPEEVFHKVTNLQPLGQEQLARLPAPLREIMARLLHPDPAQRPAAAELEEALGDVLGYSGVVQAKQILSVTVQRLFRDEITIEAEIERSGSQAAPAAAESAFGDVVMGTLPSIDHDALTAPPHIPPDVLASTRKTPAPGTMTLGSTAMPVEVLPGKSAGRIVPVLLALGLAAALAVIYVQARPRPSQPVGLASLAPPPPTPLPSPSPSLSATASPVPSPTPREATPTPTTIATHPTRHVPAIAHLADGRVPGQLNVFAKPWVSVEVDGKLVSPDTPLRGFVLSAGKHSVVFANDAGYRHSQTIEIPSGKAVEVTVDVSGDTVSVR